MTVGRKRRKNQAKVDRRKKIKIKTEIDGKETRKPIENINTTKCSDF